MMKNIRNFSIIAHIDHGKSTLADRMLEVTNTIEKRKMRDQVLDSMELERERGITIKMQPVRMHYASGGKEYILNLIDTPGHIDFAYEVSRALKAVEGSILLVDATQGVQAQTFSTLDMAREQGLVIIPVLSKIDSPLARVGEVKQEVAELLKCSLDDILLCSGKTGEGVGALLEAVIERVPAPESHDNGGDFQALVFDFQYSNHRGIIVYVRVFSGSISKNIALRFSAAHERFLALETGIFAPQEQPSDNLSDGEIGYIVTGIKKPGVASVGDTLIFDKSGAKALPGYLQPRPVVWASVYPESQDDFNLLKQSLLRLRLSDSSLSFEEESSGSLGRGFRCGFLGMLHLEIITERLRREFGLELVVTTPSITYEVTYRDGTSTIVYSPSKFPDHGETIHVREPWTILKIIVPHAYVSPLMQLLYDHEGVVTHSETFGDSTASEMSSRVVLSINMPLRELMRNFFDQLKNVTSGYASFSYEIGEMRPADVVRLDLLVAEELVPAFSRVVARRRVEEEAERAVERLFSVLPRQMFVTKIQGKALGRIISSKTLSALKKDVTGYLYGGDITRKMKLREKQKKGKKKMLARGKVNIPHDVFLKMMRGE
ncbi:MAG TPA: translation elongation factor 4 [Candidatus Paceibacterota bacterium]